MSVERSVEPLSQLFPEAGRAMPSPETQRRESAAADLRRELRIEGSGLKTNLGTHCSKPPFSTPFEDSGTCHPDLFLDPCVSVFIRGLGIEGEQPTAAGLSRYYERETVSSLKPDQNSN